MDWDSYNRERIENIKEQVHITQVLAHYGINVRTMNREFQYPCPLHGDGQDNSYSARMYPDSNSTYCFACHKDRDVVEWVRDQEGLSFGKALSYIERSFGVKNIPKPKFDPSDEKTRKEMQTLLRKQETAPTLLDGIERVEAKARRMIRESRDEIKRKKAVRTFFLLDMLRFDVQHGEVDDQKASKVLQKVSDAVHTWGLA
jgi:DNA primase